MPAVQVELSSFAAQVGLSHAELQQALAGDVPAHSESFKSGSGKAAGRGVGAVVIERPLAEVWSTLARFEDRAEYIPRLKAIELLERTGPRVRVLQVVDAGITTARTTLWFELDEAASTIAWTLDPAAPDNSVVAVEGDYRMLALAPRQTLLAYRTHIDTGLRIPQLVQSHMQKRAVPDLLRAIKKRVESGGTWRR
jgi:carbon monoxide dehydrogenase subunit G